jgi:hypothetical protein
MGEEFTLVVPRYRLNATSAGSVPSSRQATKLPLPDRALISPRSRSSTCRASPAGGVGVTVGVGVGVGPVEPVQVTPLSVNAAGTGLAVLFHEALKPNETVASVASAALYPASAAVTWVPLWVIVEFQAWVTCWPAVKPQPSFQPLIGSPRLVTATVPLNPPAHWVGTE